MGSSAGWMDVLTMGGASAEREAARREAEAAEAAAKAQEEAARAQRAQQLAPVEVTPTTKNAMQNAETRVDTANKRKRTVSSTAQGINRNALGGSGSSLG